MDYMHVYVCNEPKFMDRQLFWPVVPRNMILCRCWRFESQRHLYISHPRIIALLSLQKNVALCTQVPANLSDPEMESVLATASPDNEGTHCT